jgi:hypothetical protein
MCDEAKQRTAYRTVHGSLERRTEPRFGSPTDLKCSHATVRYPRLTRSGQEGQDEAIELHRADDAFQMHRVAPEWLSRMDLKPHPGAGDKGFLRADRMNSNGANEDDKKQSRSNHGDTMEGGLPNDRGFRGAERPHRNSASNKHLA